jgi:molybdenum cofactor synthesis domain-containing protein
MSPTPRALVITASTRAAAGTYTDRSGPVLAHGLRQWGFDVDGPVVAPDGAPVGEALAHAVLTGYELVLTSGGTGLSPADRTPEVTAPQLITQLPGISEALRADGVRRGVPTAMLSRGVAGIAGSHTLVINLPGSVGACADALVVLEPVVRHAIDQLRGHGHDEAAQGGQG